MSVPAMVKEGCAAPAVNEGEEEEEEEGVDCPIFDGDRLPLPPAARSEKKATHNNCWRKT